MSGTADCALRAQILHKFLLQHTARLDKQASIDRLVRHLIVLFLRVRPLKPACNLFRRPVQLKLPRYCSAQGSVASQLTKLGAKGTIPGGLIRLDRSIVTSAAIAFNFATDGRGGALQVSGNTTQRQAAPQDLSISLHARPTSGIISSAYALEVECHLFVITGGRSKMNPVQTHVRWNSWTRRVANDPISRSSAQL